MLGEVVAEKVWEGEEERVYCRAGREGEAGAVREDTGDPEALVVAVTEGVEVTVVLALLVRMEVTVALGVPVAPSSGEAEAVGEGDTLVVAAAVKLELPTLADAVGEALGVAAVEMLALTLGVDVVL